MSDELERSLLAPITLPTNCELNFGLRWDFVGDEPFDLDVSAVSFDDKGNPQEVVYFNKLTTKGEWMVHTGDNTTGEGDDDDEAIQVFLSKVPMEIHSIVLVITCHNAGYNLGSVDSVVCQVTDMSLEDPEPICEIPVYLSKEHTATVVCNLHRADAPFVGTQLEPRRGTLAATSSPKKNPLVVRSDTTETITQAKSFGSQVDNIEREASHTLPGIGGWELVELNVPAHGNSVGDRGLIFSMRKCLGIPEDMLPETMKLGIIIDSQKRSAVQIHPDVDHVVFGVGWTKGDDDLDCTLIYFDKSKGYRDHVNSKNKLISTDGACVHRGDSVLTTRSHASHDKETVDIKFLNICDEADIIYFAVSTVEREGKWASRFSQVEGAYCRLFEVKKKVLGKGKTHNVEDRKELVRCNLSKAAKDSIGMIFAAMYRDPSEPSGWFVQPIQEPLYQLPHACISPSEFMPVTRALSYFLRNNYKTQSGEWVPAGWCDYRKDMYNTRLLQLTVCEARGLGPQGKIFGPHVQVWSMDEGKERQKERTRASDDRACPQWGETFYFTTTFLSSLKIVVFDRYFIGTVTLPMVEHKGNMKALEDAWHPLQGEDVEGEVRLKISFSTERAREPTRRREGGCVVG